MKPSIPGFASPIEFSMPVSVSAIRTGALPSRGSGVTVFVTNASSSLATSGRGEGVQAARGVEDHAAAASRGHGRGLTPDVAGEDGALDAEAGEAAVDLDGAAVARSVAAGHRGLPRELGARRQPPDCFEHRLGPAGEDVEAGLEGVGHEGGLDHDLGVREGERLPAAWSSVRKPRIAGGAPRRSERYGKGARPIPPPDEERALDVEPNPFPSGPEDIDVLPRARAPTSARVPGPIGSTRNPSSPPGARQRLIGRGSSWPRRAQHEELPGDAPARADRARGAGACTGRPARRRRL